jgi:hypothetical protein
VPTDRFVAVIDAVAETRPVLGSVEIRDVDGEAGGQIIPDGRIVAGENAEREILAAGRAVRTWGHTECGWYRR